MIQSHLAVSLLNVRIWTLVDSLVWDMKFLTSLVEEGSSRNHVVLKEAASLDSRYIQVVDGATWQQQVGLATHGCVVIL